MRVGINILTSEKNYSLSSFTKLTAIDFTTNSSCSYLNINVRFHLSVKVVISELIVRKFLTFIFSSI